MLQYLLLIFNLFTRARGADFQVGAGEGGGANANA